MTYKLLTNENIFFFTLADKSLLMCERSRETIAKTVLTGKTLQLCILSHSVIYHMIHLQQTNKTWAGKAGHLCHAEMPPSFPQQLFSLIKPVSNGKICPTLTCFSLFNYRKWHLHLIVMIKLQHIKRPVFWCLLVSVSSGFKERMQGILDESMSNPFLKQQNNISAKPGCCRKWHLYIKHFYWKMSI